MFQSHQNGCDLKQGTNFLEEKSERILLNNHVNQECFLEYFLVNQRAKKVVSNSPGLVDFAIGLVNSVFNLPDGQMMFFEEFE